MIDARFRAEEMITQRIPCIKQTLIEKYGLEYQDIINEKIDAVTIIPFFSNGATAYTLNTIIANKTKQYITEFLIKNNIEPTENNIRNYFGYSPSFRYIEDFALSTIYSYSSEKEYPSYIQDKYIGIIEKITGEKVEFRSDRFNAIMNELNEYRDSYQELLSKYDDIKVEYKSIADEIEKEDNNKKTINEKYEKKYFEYIKQFMNEDDKKKVENPFFLLNSSLSCYDELISCSYYSKTLYDAFTKESFELINGEQNYMRKSVIEDQIKYFKKHGIEVSFDEFEEFMKSTQYKDNLPDLELVEKLKTYREELHQKELIELLSLSPTWSNLRKKVDPLNLRDPKIDPLTEIAGIILVNQTCVITYPNDKNERTDVLLFDLGHFEEYLDNALIHEIEHVITTLTGTLQEGEPGRSGFEIFPKDENEFRRYEQINEIINEIEAQETTTMLHQKGDYILNNPEKAKIIGGTNYERNRFMVNDFFKEFKTTIRESRIYTDLNIMYDRVGKENFEALVDLVNDFTITFSGGIYYKIIDDLNNGRDTELTQKYKEYYTKSQEILKNMKEYKVNNSNVLSA